MSASIVSVSFGDKSAIARTLTTKGTELKASVLESAVIPMLSNALSGHSTFNNLISGKGHNDKCPLQSALWQLTHTKTGKSATNGVSRAIIGAFALSHKAVDQLDHDDTISEAILVISEAITPLPKEQAERTDYRALAESLQSRIEALLIDNAELSSANTELLAKLASMTVSATVPATA